MKKTKRKIDDLTKAVLSYKRRHNNQLLEYIGINSERLIYSVMKYYNIYYFPKIIQEDIIGECKTLILLKAIREFKKVKNVKFSTWYVWKLKSYIHKMRDFYLRRKKLIEHSSLNRVYGEGGVTLENKLTTFDTRYKIKVSKRIRDIFGVK